MEIYEFPESIVEFKSISHHMNLYHQQNPHFLLCFDAVCQSANIFMEYAKSYKGAVKCQHTLGAVYKCNKISWVEHICNPFKFPVLTAKFLFHQFWSVQVWLLPQFTVFWHTFSLTGLSSTVITTASYIICAMSGLTIDPPATPLSASSSTFVYENPFPRAPQHPPGATCRTGGKGGGWAMFGAAASRIFCNLIVHYCKRRDRHIR